MFLRKKAQSTAEYAITIGLVVAVTAGVLQMALKGGMRQKHKEAMNVLLGAGSTAAAGGDYLSAYDVQTEAVYNQEARRTTVDANEFVDESVMKQGGATETYTKQKTATTSTEVELIEEVDTTSTQ